MSETELEELLETEGVDSDGVDDLLAWARTRAEELVGEAEADPELAPLLGKEAPAVDGEVARDEPAPEWKSELPSHPDAPQENQEAEPADHAEGQTNEQEEEADDGEDEEEEIIEEIEELDIEELELLDEDEDEDEDEDAGDSGEAEGEPAAEGAPAAPPEPPPEPPAEAPSFGPPDGNENVPAWKAALFSAQTGDDAAAAQRVEEESGLKPLPTPPEEPAVSTRLESEEDEISHHSIDLERPRRWRRRRRVALRKIA